VRQQALLRRHLTQGQAFARARPERPVLARLVVERVVQPLGGIEAHGGGVSLAGS
jgi:hypothetical protein